MKFVRDSNSIYENTAFEFDIRIRHRKSNIRIRTFAFVIKNLTFVFDIRNLTFVKILAFVIIHKKSLCHHVFCDMMSQFENLVTSCHNRYFCDIIAHTGMVVPIIVLKMEL